MLETHLHSMRPTYRFGVKTSLIAKKLFNYGHYQVGENIGFQSQMSRTM